MESSNSTKNYRVFCSKADTNTLGVLGNLHLPSTLCHYGLFHLRLISGKPVRCGLFGCVDALAETRVKLPFLFWHTWHHQNNLIHGDVKSSIWASIQLYWKEVAFEDTNGNQREAKRCCSPTWDRRTNIDDCSRWSSPPPGYFIENDACWENLTNKAGIGTIA